MNEKTPAETMVAVRYPQTHIEPEKYTDYEIVIETTDIAFSHRRSAVRRRYSEFVWLHKHLSAISGIHIEVPPLPPKQVVGRFDLDFIETRRAGLQAFLEKILQHPRFLAEETLHLFLQTTSSTVEIDKIVFDQEGDQPLHPDSTINPAVLLCSGEY